MSGKCVAHFFTKLQWAPVEVAAFVFFMPLFDDFEEKGRDKVGEKIYIISVRYEFSCTFSCQLARWIELSASFIETSL